MYTIQAVCLWLFWVIFVFGNVGNILAMIVFLRRRFNNTVFEIYFPVMIVLAIIELLYSIIDFLNYQYGINIQLLSYIGCTLASYVSFAVASMNSWILVLVGLDRMLTIVFGVNKFKFKNTKIFKFLVCAVITVYSFAICSPIIIDFEFYQVSSFNNVTNTTGIFNF